MNKITKSINPPSYCRFKRNDKLEFVEVTEVITINGACFNTIVFGDGETKEVKNDSLIFDHE